MTTRALMRSVALVMTTVAIAACSERSSALDPHGPESQSIASLSWVMFGLAITVYVIVASLILAGAFRSRRRDPERAQGLSDEKFVWIGGIIVPAIILATLGVLTVTTSNAIRGPERGPLAIDVTGVDWWWDVRYPTKHVTTADEIHVPVGQPITMRLRSRDVIHSFWVPELAGKVDTIPGQTNVLRFRADQPGTYVGVCAEFCGLGHAHMGITVVAESPGAFGRWVELNRQPVSEPSSELAARGETIFMREACAGCHTVRGTPAQGTRGPDLTHVDDRQTLGARAVLNTADGMLRWILDPADEKPGARMPGHLVSRAEARAIVAYLRSHR